ncbi:MAG: NAD-dependent deacylase [Desulfobacterales bacterium]|nr:MAG: NAD-dependent deacylase [Desulfobacterales bacterium]
MQAPYKEIAELLLKKGQCVALTGAGISAESGIPTFRSKGGMWEKYDPMVYASAEVFRQDPSKYWTIRGDFIRGYGKYKPNAAHFALVDLEKMGILRHVITQNIDGLHKSAGSKSVTEIHGSLREIYCLKCGKEYLAPHVPEGLPPYCDCGGVLKPNTVLFGEQLPQGALERAYRESSTCRSMLVIGTSAVVQPAASLPYVAKQSGAAVIEINPEKSFAGADYYCAEKAGAALPAIVAEVQQNINSAENLIR